MPRNQKSPSTCRRLGIGDGYELHCVPAPYSFANSQKRRSQGTRSKKIIFRFTALLTLFAFVTTNTGTLSAAPINPQTPIPLEKKLSLQQIALDPAIGKIEETYQSPNQGPVVVLIQDAHAIPEAQRNIRKIIEHFQKEYGVGLVGLEGAASRPTHRF